MSAGSPKLRSLGAARFASYRDKYLDSLYVSWPLAALELDQGGLRIGASTRFLRTLLREYEWRYTEIDRVEEIRSGLKIFSRQWSLDPTVFGTGVVLGAGRGAAKTELMALLEDRGVRVDRGHHRSGWWGVY